jgi:DNA (cytosine-5)-methyltransferase 1
MGFKIDAVDLFCGAGGLAYGLQKSGIDVKLGIDIEAACKYPFEANNKAKFLLKSVVDIKKEELEQYYSREGDYRLLAGCAPCQTFSTYNAKACSTDNRWWLLLQFSRLVKETIPDLVTMENVPGLEKQEVFFEFVSDLKAKGYDVYHKVVNSADYGLPQNRKRLVLLASKLGKISLLTPKELKIKVKTVRQAISALPPLKAGEVYTKDPLHQSALLSDLNMKRMKHSVAGGTWEDWPIELRAECHKKDTGKTFRGVYGRMEWDKPAPTMTTQFTGFGNGRFGHPEQDRAISLREGAIFQGFPKNYKFVPKDTPISKGKIARMIGNAVPVKLGEVIGKSIVEHVRKYQSDINDVA